MSTQKHLGLILDEKLNFKDHLRVTLDKANRGIGILQKLRHYIPRQSLVTLYKLFIRSYLDFADVIYDQPTNKSFCDKLESLQYNAVLAITGLISGTSKEKLYKELRLDYLSSRRWFKRLSMFYKILKNQSPSYLYELIPQSHHLFNLRNQNWIPEIFCRTESFRNSFLPYTIREWNKLGQDITQKISFQSFRNILLKSIRPTANSVYGFCDPHGLKLLTRLRVGLSHLREHKFRHGFNDTIDPFCPCNMEIETVSHFFLRCHFFNALRIDLMNELFIINLNLQHFNDITLTEFLLYGSNQFSYDINSKIISLSVNFIIKSEKLDDTLL